MRNCIILGSGRSGTSMVAGTLANSGYFMGDQLYPARESNPKGFFEAPNINTINEEIIDLNKSKENKILKYFFRYSPVQGQKWLTCLTCGGELLSSNSIDQRISAAIVNQPFCYKDPRFCYTLPIWRKKISSTVYICVFRDPSVTVNSILKECKESFVLEGLNINFNIAMKVWINMYTHVLGEYAKGGSWLFIHYDQVLTDEGLMKIKKLTGASIDGTFPDAKLKRTQSTTSSPIKARLIYDKLSQLAGYKDNQLIYL